MKLAATLLGMLLLAWPAQADFTSYEIEDDEFGDGQIHSIFIGTMDTQQAGLFIRCWPDGREDIQIALRRMIRYDERLGGNLAGVSVTRSIDGNHAETTQWLMLFSNPRSVLMDPDHVPRTLDLLPGGKRLSVRLDQQATILRFDLTEALAHLPTLRAACAGQDASSG